MRTERKAREGKRWGKRRVEQGFEKRRGSEGGKRSRGSGVGNIEGERNRNFMECSFTNGRDFVTSHPATSPLPLVTLVRVCST